MSRSGNIITWTANRDDPPVSSNSTIELTLNGTLILKSEPLTPTMLIADTSHSASHASMLDTGNFVLIKEGEPIWESFHSPTDTLLGGQKLSNGSELVSRKSEDDHSTGRFRLKMQLDGNLVLYPIHTQDISFDAYWASNTVIGISYDLLVNTSGSLVLVSRNDPKNRTYIGGSSLKHNSSIIYRATLYVDGFFRLFSHVFNESSVGFLSQTSEEWFRPEKQCDVKGFCGINSYCTQNDAQSVCRCLPGTDFQDKNMETHGCVRNFTENFCNDTNAIFKSNASSSNIVSMENMMWLDHPYFRSKMVVKDECMRLCMEDCDCDAALFDPDGYCTKQRLPLKYAGRVFDEQYSAFFKVGMTNLTYYDRKRKPHGSTGETRSNKLNTTLLLVVTLSLVTFSCVTLVITGLFMVKLRDFEYKKLLENPGGLGEELSIRSFSYKELNKATNGFKEELGKGSFGAVYKGVLYRGTKIVAVKRLEKLVDDGEREFRAEMQVIGRTHHKNLVRLHGYCAEESKRLLVYEYMSNGSLADILFRTERRLVWTERIRVALEIARGILYLHEKCQIPIIHCDIKPQNILMDEFWTAKISDFGLAKLLLPDQTKTFTMVRGTRGYLAPEWNKNVPISVKADIYSYGVMLLEIVSCRRNIEVNVSSPEEIVLAAWVYKNFSMGEVEKVVGSEEEVEKKSLENLVKVGIWCIQDEPTLRPSMKSVVMMLEGRTEIAVPPCPTASFT